MTDTTDFSTVPIADSLMSPLSSSLSSRSPSTAAQDKGQFISEAWRVGMANDVGLRNLKQELQEVYIDLTSKHVELLQKVHIVQDKVERSKLNRANLARGIARLNSKGGGVQQTTRRQSAFPNLDIQISASREPFRQLRVKREERGAVRARAVKEAHTRIQQDSSVFDVRAEEELEKRFKLLSDQHNESSLQELLDMARVAILWLNTRSHVSNPLEQWYMCRDATSSDDIVTFIRGVEGHCLCDEAVQLLCQTMVYSERIGLEFSKGCIETILDGKTGFVVADYHVDIDGTPS